MTSPGVNDSERRLAELYDAFAHRVLAYAVRQVGSTDADDVLSETYAVAWRRLSRVPSGDEALPWLLAVARNVVRNDRRSAGRRLGLTSRLRETMPTTSPGAGQLVAEREEMLAALGALTEREREALLLTAWDGLDHDAAAQVTGCSARAFRARASRARARLGQLLDAPDDDTPRAVGSPRPATTARSAACSTSGESR